MLQLLQQRTKLSGQIGQMKRRHGAVIYVPERERELVARLARVSGGQPPARAVAAIYREIMSASRAEQGQTPIGLLAASASLVLPASQTFFGASDQFVPQKSWAEMAKGLQSGALSLALLTGADLGTLLASPRWRRDFLTRYAVRSDFSPAVPELKGLLGWRIFIVTPRPAGPPPEGDRIVILIECKSTQSAIKSLLHSMPTNPIQAVHAEQWTSRPAGPVTLVRLHLAQPMDGDIATDLLVAAGKQAGHRVSVLGIYPGTEDYGG